MSRKKINIADLNLRVVSGRFIYVRLMAGKKQGEFADSLGISKTTASNIENRKHEPSFLVLQALIQKYDVSPAWLLTGEGEPYIKDREKGGGGAKDTAPPDREETTIYKDKGAGRQADAGGAVYNKDGQAGAPEPDPFRELLQMTVDILASQTDYAASLAANIRSFHKSVELEKRTSSLEQKCDELVEEVLNLKKTVSAQARAENEEGEVVLPEAANRKQ